jgi:hypothetical protein
LLALTNDQGEPTVSVFPTSEIGKKTGWVLKMKDAKPEEILIFLEINQHEGKINGYFTGLSFEYVEN